MGKAVIIGRAAAQQNRHASKWQEECVAINRQKGKQRWWGTFRRRMKIVGTVVLSAYLGLAGWWVWHSKQLEKAYDVSKMWVLDQTVHAGFELKRITLDGIERLPADVIVEAMEVTIGDPILPLSVNELKRKLEAIPEVRHAKVERVLPNQLNIDITERSASAVWQYKGVQKLIDLDGTVLENQERKAGKKYIVLVGEDVPEHAQSFLKMIEGTPALYEKVSAAKRVGARRWDVTMSPALTVKLPQEKPQAAWQKFSQLVAEEQLLDKAIQAIDMRIEDRLFIKIDQATAEAQNLTVLTSSSGGYTP